MNRCLLLLIVVAVPGRAAPPTLTALFPAGGPRGKTVEVTAAGAFARWPVQAWCSDRGVSLTPLKERGKFNVTIAATAAPGTAWVRLHDEEGASVLRPFLIGFLPELAEKEPNDDVKSAQRVEGDAVVNGKLEKPGDVDCVAVALKKGQTLVADVVANETLGSPMDGVLQVVSADGFVLAENNDERGLDPGLAFTATRDGVHVVRLFAFPATADSSIRFAGADTYVYRLTLTAGPCVDRVFPLAVPRDSATEVETLGWNLSERRLKISPGDEEEVSLFEPGFLRPLRVRREGHPCVVEKEPNERAAPQGMSLPATISGRLDPAGDVDVYRFEAKKGQPLLIQLEAKTLGFPTEAVLRLTDALGKTLLEQQATAGRDPALAYTPTGDGNLHVEVRDLYQHGGARHLYRLRLTRPEPSLALTLKADRFTAAAGKTLEVPVTVEARNGFKEELTITVEGLPEGASAPAVKWTPASGGTAVLKITATKGPVSGGFRIVGKGSRTYSATATGLSPLWLTVVR